MRSASDVVCSTLTSLTKLRDNPVTDQLTFINQTRGDDNCQAQFVTPDATAGSNDDTRQRQSFCIEARRQALVALALASRLLSSASPQAAKLTKGAGPAAAALRHAQVQEGQSAGRPRPGLCRLLALSQVRPAGRDHPGIRQLAAHPRCRRHRGLGVPVAAVRRAHRHRRALDARQGRRTSSSTCAPMRATAAKSSPSCSRASSSSSIECNGEWCHAEANGRRGLGEPGRDLGCLSRRGLYKIMPICSSAACLSGTCMRGPICWITSPAARLPRRPQSASSKPLV